MNLFARIFLGYCLLIAVAGFLMFNSVMDELRPATRQTLEESMVDTANLLAEIAAPHIANGQVAPILTKQMDAFLQRRPSANISGLTKDAAAYRIYITDAAGIVIYDSHGEGLGKDYSQWNDVYLTLRGEYGARSSRSDPNDPRTSTMYIAAPIIQNGIITGVLTVAKPSISIQPFIDMAQRKIITSVLVLLAAALVLGGLLSYFLTRSLRTLLTYAEEVKMGRKTQAPMLPEPEFQALSLAMRDMRQALENRDYVQQYVHALTHEIKSPLTAIAGAAELLDEPLPDAQRARFTENIRHEAARIRQLIDRLLELASVEARLSLDEMENISLLPLLESVIARKEAMLTAKEITLECHVSPDTKMVCDPFLMEQALSNILDNAIDFSGAHSCITITERWEHDVYHLSIQDEGAGIPDYALERVRERFYSLPRPDGGAKSTGLGLPFVDEVMMLHGGYLEIESQEGKGTTVHLVL